jgi:hypothetical protein
VEPAVACHRTIIHFDFVLGKPGRTVAAWRTEILGNPDTQVLKRVVHLAAGGADAALLMTVDVRAALGEDALRVSPRICMVRELSSGKRDELAK